MTDYERLISYGNQALDDSLLVAEKQLAKMYREAYKQAEQQLVDLYARLGDKLSLEEAQKYKRLENTIANIAKEYRNITGKAIELAGDTSSSAFVGAYQTNWFGMEKALGTSLEFGVLPVQAIRDSVYSQISGADFVKRFGKLYASSIETVAEAITRGLATGQGYAKTASELKESFAGSYANAVRVVRTESTRNFTNGSIVAYDRAKELGIDGSKVWLTTFDGRTRDSHAQLNGKEANDKGIFKTSWGNSIGPGDGPAGEVINCRCSTYYKIDGVEGAPDWKYSTWKKEFSDWQQLPPRQRK